MQRFWSRNVQGTSGEGAAAGRGDRVHAEPSRSYRRALRPVLAVSFTAMLIAAFGIFGGPGYASSVKHQVTKVVHVFQAPSAPHGVSNDTRAGADSSTGNAGKTHADSPKHEERGEGVQGNDNDDNEGGDDDQYRPGKGCGDRNHVHSRHNECHGHGHDD